MEPNNKPTSKACPECGTVSWCNYEGHCSPECDDASWARLEANLRSRVSSGDPTAMDLLGSLFGGR